MNIQFHQQTECLDEKVRFHPGYEAFFNTFPVIKADTDSAAKGYASWIMKSLSAALSQDRKIYAHYQLPGTFSRTYIGMETRYVTPDGLQQGAELVIAHWGKDFETPIHDHGEGFIHEEMLSGALVETSYRQVDPGSKTVRFTDSKIFTTGTIESEYHAPGSIQIHSVRAVEPATSVHFFPERRQNDSNSPYILETFEEVFHLTPAYLSAISFEDYLRLQPGQVALVRSENVPYFQDHYLVVTGGVTTKPHGQRLRNITIPAPKTTHLLDFWESHNGLTILQLSPYAQKRFHEFHNI